jgi:diguanylate cyclase (GGDEF)-like protein
MATHVINVYPEVERELLGAISRVSPDLQLINDRIQGLELRYGIDVYKQLLYLLCHLDLSGEDAKGHWVAVLKHKKRFEERLGQDIDFRVALLDYFISVNKRFESPKIIEIKIFQKTQDCAFRDELTGLYNYRFFCQELEREIRRAERTAGSVSLVLFDVDHFKCYNDLNGHLEGDKALREVGCLIRQEIRETDTAARYGGEEFAIILPDATKPQAYKVADRIRKCVCEYPFSGAQRQPYGVFSLSGGVATYRADAGDGPQLIEAADRALYRAKGGGRNRILTAGMESRNFPRYAVRLPGTLQVIAGEAKNFVTENLSGQGIQIRSFSKILKDDYFRFSFSLLDGGPQIEGVACAVRVREDGGQYEVGARIMEISHEHSHLLLEFLQKEGKPNFDSCVEVEGEPEPVPEREPQPQNQP